MAQKTAENEQIDGMDANLYRIRHSLAHILAQAVMALRPGTKLGFGPPIEDGFYYDFILPTPLTEADLPEIEKKMRHLIRQGQSFAQEELPHDEAMKRLEDMGEPYKREYAEELFKKQNLKTLSFYKSGSFVDMCEGPHVTKSTEIPEHGFKLRAVSGAYWRGDSKNQMMTRIYAWAFLTKEELDEKVSQYKLALERDHKKLGQELDMFAFDDDIGKGLALWLPNGTAIREELEKFIKEKEFQAGYHRVASPHLAKLSLYYKTGHMPYYAPHMFPPMQVKESDDVKEAYSLKPMNCPHHHKIFASRPRSYRDLPIRYAEYGHVYRYEDSGALSGLLRVRGMCMNDAHIYCSKEQIKSEFREVLKMHEEVYKVLGITNYYLRLSTWDPEDPKGKEKYVDNPAEWEYTQNLLREVLDDMGLDYREGKGEAAFYGPKIDIQFRTLIGREETASTCQLDFVMAERLGLTYRGADNSDHRPYIIHRAPLGTHERFVAFLIEHYGGAFPTWLAPIQVRVIPVGEKFMEYAESLSRELHEKFVRVEVDRTSDSFNKRIRLAVTQKIPNVIIVGEREQQNQEVTVRRYGKKDQDVLPRKGFVDQLLEEIRQRV